MSQQESRTVRVVMVKPDLAARIRVTAASQAFRDFVAEMGDTAGPISSAGRSISFAKPLSVSKRAKELGDTRGLDLMNATRAAIAELTSSMPCSPAMETAIRELTVASTPPTVQGAADKLAVVAVATNNAALQEALAGACVRAMQAIGLSTARAEPLTAAVTRVFGEDQYGRAIMTEVRLDREALIESEVMGAEGTCIEMMDAYGEALRAEGVELEGGWRVPVPPRARGVRRHVGSSRMGGGR